MSTINKFSFDLRLLSKELQISSVPYSGWPPPRTILPLKQVKFKKVSSITNIQTKNSTSIVIDKNLYDQKRSTWRNHKSYFEKLRSTAENRHTNKRKSYLTTTNDSISSGDQTDDLLENLIESIQPSNTWNSTDIKTNKSKTDMLLAQFEYLKEMYINNTMNKSIEKKVQQSFHKDTFLIITKDGNILFDFSNQSINYNIYIQLMHLVRLSNLDKIIEKIFHKSGEYHHEDYKEKRRNQLIKDQKNSSDHSIYKLHHLNTHFSSEKEYQLLNTNHLLKSSEIDQMNFSLTIAKSVHFRALSHCFVLNGIDISSRFQHDRNILQDICLRIHSYAEINQTIQHILVLCTDRMKQIYRLFESLLKLYISPYISIIYITFDYIEPFLFKYEQMSREIFENNPSKSSSNTILIQPVDFKDEFNVNTIMKEENNTNSTSEENQSSNEIDSSNEEHLLTSLRTSSLVLIFMKHLNKTFLTIFIRWYIEDCLNTNQSLKSNWNKFIEHFWLITNDYQHVETILNLPKSNLFLWPTEYNEYDHISIIISSILSLPIALNINYENYLMFINGMSIVDQHCQETTIDQNVCIYMALIRIWSNICERKTIGIITYDNELQYFNEYLQMLFDENYQNKMINIDTSIHRISLDKILNEENNYSYDLISIKQTDINEKLFSTAYSHSFILLDQFTPLTLGVLIGVYQLSIFFEKFIHNQ